MTMNATPMSERSARDLADEMHELSVHLWNALKREHPTIWMRSETRDEVERMQKLLGELVEVTPNAGARR
jgi:hypothetical protein